MKDGPLTSAQLWALHVYAQAVSRANNSGPYRSEDERVEATFYRMQSMYEKGPLVHRMKLGFEDANDLIRWADTLKDLPSEDIEAILEQSRYAGSDIPPYDN